MMDIKIKGLIKNIIPFFILLLIVFVETLNLWRADTIDMERLELTTEQQLENVSNKIESSYDQLTLSLDYINEINSPIHKDDEKKWVSQATYIMDTFDEITSISYVSNELVVSYVVAADGYEALKVGDKVNDIRISDTIIQLWNPSYEEGIIKGFILSSIDLKKLLESELSLISENYVVDVRKGNQRIYEINQESAQDMTKDISRLIVLENNDTYRITMAPTSQYITEIRINNIVLFVFILALTLIVMLLFRISKKSHAKSVDLEKTKEELLKKQEELFQMIIKANLASKAKGEFLANMSHEIRTPISAIIGMNYLLSQTYLNEKQVDYNKKIELASQNLLAIINNILDFSKIEAGKIELNITDFSMMDVVEHIVNILARKAQDKELEFAVNISSDIPYILYGDSMRLEQALINLVANAIKFTKSGEVVIQIVVKTNKDDQVLIKFIVRDTGIGMTSDEQLKLFVEFEQAQKGIAKEYGGTGLGLSITKKLVGLMGGDIEVTSEKDIGSEFCFELPFKYEKGKVCLTNELKLDHLKVMIVDDSNAAATILESYVSIYFSDITIADSGEKAITKYLASECGYDIIFMDWKMPGLNGIETAQIIANHDASNHTKIVMVTAYLKDEVMTGIAELNIDSLIYKPVIPRKLCELLMRLYPSNASAIDKEVLIKSSGKEIHSNSHMRGGSKKILVVEDNAFNQQILFEILRVKGYEVELANDGLEAVKMVKNQNPTIYDLIIMDLHMPNLNGYEATKLIYATSLYRRIPIIALTAEVLKDTESKVLQSGMMGYLTKPINQVELFRTIESIFDKQYVDGDNAILSDHSKVLDVQEGISRLMNNKAVYFKILRNFKIEYENVYDELELFLETKNYAAFNLKIHSLKGLSGNISANKLFTYLGTMNDLVNEGNYEQIQLHLNELKSDLEDLFITIEDNLKNPIETMEKVTEEVAINKDDTIKLLEEISHLFEQDYGLVEEKFRTLEQILRNSKYYGQMEKLEKYINEFDVEGATLVIQNILELLIKDDTY